MTTTVAARAAAELRERVAATVARAWRELGEAPPVPAEDGALAGVREALAEVDARLGAAGATNAADVHRAAIAQLERRFEERFDALARVRAAIAGLRRVTSPSAMLARAPGALCEGSPFTRAIVSSVRGSVMVPEAAHFAGDAPGAHAVLEALRAEPVRLEQPLIETEVLRRRRATLVASAAVDPRVDQRLAELLGWRSYVVAPLIAGSAAIGILHADRGPDTELDPPDLELVREFAGALSHAHESASLRRTLGQERDQLRRFLEWLNGRSGVLSDSPITLAPAEPEPLIAPSEQLPPTGSGDDRLVLSGLLTRRELDVLRLLADGGTNRTIAAALVLSETTIKFHVNSILRKLHVANRAEAVARYLTLLGVATP
jgi:DNA-binding CsgD family transcriptional regulator/GAF domain-containing protein